MKKVATLVLIMILFNFICLNYISLADTDSGDSPDDTEMEQDATLDMEQYKKIADDGKVTIGSSEKEITLAKSDVGNATSKLGTFITTIAAFGVKWISSFTNKGGYYYYESDFSAEQTGIFTINSLVFGEYVLFNSKPYQKSSDLATNPSYKPDDINKSIDSIKETGALISGIVKNAALALAFPMFLVAIVKAIFATTAQDLAAWKKIMARWAICILLMFLYQYVFAIIDAIAYSLVDSFWNVRVGLETSGYNAFEISIMKELAFQLENTGGVTSLAYGITFALLFIMQLLFLVKYAIRAFGILLIFIITPAIVLIHSFRLMLGSDSDLLGRLFKNYIALVFMQPLHAMFYLIFLFTFSEMAIKVPVLGIILLYALYRAGQIAKAMFGWELGSSIFSK